MYQTCYIGYEWHTQICRSSIIRSKWGGGGVSQKLTFAHRGGGGVWRGAKSAHVILEQPLIRKEEGELWSLSFEGSR